MKCPYNRKKLTQISQTSNDIANEEVGSIKSNQQVIKEEYEMMDCVVEECGAWKQSHGCDYFCNITTKPIERKEEEQT